MTTEQAKQLKKGDKILVAAEVDTVYSALREGYILISCRDSPSDRITFNGAYTLTDNIILPTDLQQPAEKPKYDPCRKFKKGDKVRVVERHGRKFWNAAPETIYTVVADEYLHDDRSVLHRGCVGLNDGKPETCSSWNVPFFHVELVTPVEELEPYSVGESSDYFSVDKDDEAERDRLNAAHRKDEK